MVCASFSCVSAVDHTVSGSTLDNIDSVISGINNGDRVLLGNRTYIITGDQIRILNKSNITIHGQSNSQRAVLDGRHLSRIIGIDENSSVTFRFVDFINGGDALDGGAAIIIYDTITVENCGFKDNRRTNWRSYLYKITS